MLHLYTLEFEFPKQSRKEILEELETQYRELTQTLKNSADFSRSDLFAIYLDNFITNNALNDKQPRPVLLDELDFLIKNGKIRESLESTLIQKGNYCKMELSKIEPSLSKAKAALYAIIDELDDDQPPDTNQIYDAICLLKDHASSDLIAIIVSAWKRELKSFKKYYNHAPFMAETYYFWGDSRDGEEFLDAVSHYRMMESFKIGDFPETINSVVKHLDEYLMNSILEERSISFNLWIASRSETLCKKANQDLIQKALNFIIGEQNKDGWFAPSPTYYDQTKPEPNIYYTALSALVLFKIGQNSEHFEKGREAINWLTKHQSDSGAWAHYHTKWQPAKRRKGRESSPKSTIVLLDDLFVTILTVDAIRRCGSSNYDYTLQKAEEWILGQQESVGLWTEQAKDEEGYFFSDVFTTTLVLEYFDYINKQSEIDELIRTKNQLDTNAQKFAQRGLWIYFGVLIAVGVTLAILTHLLSWNVMEPWTYFISLTASIGSYVYFVVTKREFSPIAIYNQIVESKKSKNYEDFGFDISRYEKLIGAIK
jgi:hypothetical protein